MSLYVDEARVAKYMPQLPVSGEADYTASAALITQAIEEAEAVVDSHLGVKYSLPLDTDHIPPMVREIATNISVHKAYTFLYPMDNIASNVFSERYQTWEKNAYAMLELITDNKLVLTLTNGSLLSPKTTTPDVKGSHSDYSPTFDVDDPDQWCVDSDNLTAIADDRV